MAPAVATATVLQRDEGVVNDSSAAGVAKAGGQADRDARGDAEDDGSGAGYGGAGSDGAWDHESCDTFGNVNLHALEVNSDLIAFAQLTFAYSTEQINGVPGKRVPGPKLDLPAPAGPEGTFATTSGGRGPGPARRLTDATAKDHAGTR